jgi:hypothetical protein
LPFGTNFFERHANNNKGNIDWSKAYALPTTVAKINQRILSQLAEECPHP